MKGQRYKSKQKCVGLKLVAKRGSEDSDNIVKGDWKVGDPDCTWLSVWWEPTEEDYIYKSGKRTRSYYGGEKGFPPLVSSFIPESSVVYADLSSIFLGERRHMVQSLEDRRFRYEIPARLGRGRKWEPEKVERKSWWKGLLRRESDDGSVLAEVDGDFVALAFETYGSWQSDIWTFLVCRKPLANWAEYLHQLSPRFLSRTRFLSKELLTKIDLFLCNRWEHGLELISSNLSREQLLEKANEPCTKLKWQLELRTS